LNQRDVTAN